MLEWVLRDSISYLSVGIYVNVENITFYYNGDSDSFHLANNSKNIYSLGTSAILSNIYYETW